MKRSLLITALVAISTSATAQTDSYCSRFENRMQPGQLYQARCADRDDCLAPVLPHAIKKDENHRFLYRTSSAQSVQNSLAVVQLKYVGISPQAKPSKVALSRQRINFACYDRAKNYVYPAISAEAEEMERTAEVSYENYDQFYRYGYSAPSDRPALQAFHVRRYHNGERCVRTADAERAGQFLFENRQDVAGFFQTAWKRSGAQEIVGPATAQPSADILKYQRLHVYLSNYQKRPDAAGCFSFPVQGRGSAVEIAISDVEENVRSKSYGHQSWVVSVY